MNKAQLIAFEDDIAAIFNAGRIKAPVHLAGGNEDQLIKIFQEIRPQDWVLGTWRSHYHCLLKGVPPEEVKQKIIDGRSIALCFPEYRVLCSAMVGGNAPLALGIAWAIKKKNRDERVWCFLGDMSAETGVAHECFRYAMGHDLPIKFIVEDNGMSVGTETKIVWGNAGLGMPYDFYKYKMNKPHVGTGQWVAF